MAIARSSTLSRPGLPAPSLPAVASLVVNGLLIAALLTLSAGRQERWTESPSLSVLSLAALKGSDQGEEQAAEAMAQPEPSPSVQHQQTATPPSPAAVPPPAVQVPSSLALPSMPNPPVTAAATPAAVQSPASPSSTSPVVATQGSSSSPASPARRGRMDGLDANAPAGKSMAYAARVRSWLYAHKIYPRRARMQREEGVVRVRFILDRAGVLIDGMIVAGSGKSSLDEEAMAMMRRASPYPRAPENVGGERLEFTAPIEFTLPV